MLSDNSLYAPVIAGLAAGILLIAVFAFVFRPAAAMTDAELIAETSKLQEVKYFLSKYPEADLKVERWPNERTALVTYSVERQRCEPTGVLDDCIKTLMLSTEFDTMHNASSILVCGGPFSYVIGGADVIESIENNDCFSPPQQFSSPVFESAHRVNVGGLNRFIANL